ncbi:MAG: YajD family HNH nuclease [Kiritimatiellales bacterium]|nr:YajD family HNH nuclease [Kiritimatiellales bacterium]
MPPQKKKDDALDRLYKDLAEKEKGYRAQALRMYPHICGSCGREFDGKRLKELTVHHKDHDHNNNPPDGSNWELLCIYCHDNEHEKHKLKGFSSASQSSFKIGGFSAFDGLDDLLNTGGGKK